MKTTSIKIMTILCILLFLETSLTPLQAAAPPAQTTTPVPDELFDQRISLLMHLAGFSALSTCIIQDDHIVWSKGYGYYDRDQQKQATPQTIYVLASITKTIVGTALMQLYDQGLFDLDSDVNTVLPFDLRNPNFPDDPITFRMLLSHTSSLNSNNQPQYYWFNFSGDPPFDFFPEPYLREFLLPGGRYYDSSVWSTTHQPGEYAMYANVGFDIISYLVELLSGEPFLQYCDTHIFSPLEMYNTSFNLSQLPLEQVAIPYQRFLGKYYKINELTFFFKNATPPDQYWRGRFYPAGGLYSTVEDLSHFLIAHMNGGVYHGTRILQNDTVQLMHQIQPDNAVGYGLAWMYWPITPHFITTGHGGDLFGGDTWMLYNQTKDIGVIYFANGNPGYSLLPTRGLILFQILLFSLFTKPGIQTTTIHPIFTTSFTHNAFGSPQPLLR
jgi:CubicO group peptidase (beta-lactamase class C family)